MIDVVFTERHDASFETKNVINDQKLSACACAADVASKPGKSFSLESEC